MTHACMHYGQLFIGLLDIFGSEIFPVNGFEQVRGKWCVVSGEWRVVSGEWCVVNGTW